MELTNQFEVGELAPVIKAANLVSIMEPSRFDQDTMNIIADATGTDPEFIECVAEAVDEANAMMGKEDAVEVSQNYSRAIMMACEKYPSNRKPKKCGPAEVAKIVFSLDNRTLEQYSKNELANKICSYIPASFEQVKDTVRYAALNRMEDNGIHSLIPVGFDMMGIDELRFLDEANTEFPDEEYDFTVTNFSRKELMREKGPF